MAVAAGWIDDQWIYSSDPAQSGRYWIHDGWVWGPFDDAAARAAPPSTGYWIANGWIFGPEGGGDVDTGFFIRDGWIYGPSPFLPFYPRPGSQSPRVAGG
jgi:hypothetical protein